MPRSATCVTFVVLIFSAMQLAWPASGWPGQEARTITDMQAIYFPPPTGQWQRVGPADVGWDAAALEEALSYAGRRKSSGVVVLYNGRILAEQYWELPLVSNGTC